MTATKDELRQPEQRTVDDLRGAFEAAIVAFMAYSSSVATELRTRLDALSKENERLRNRCTELSKQNDALVASSRLAGFESQETR